MCLNGNDLTGAATGRLPAAVQTEKTTASVCVLFVWLYGACLAGARLLSVLAWRAGGPAKPSLRFTIHKAYHLAYGSIDRKPPTN